MNNDIKNHLIHALERNVRQDSRQPDQYRPIEIELDLIETAEGSARVKFGDTEVIAGVKLSIEKPYPDTPDQGNLMVGAELLPLSNPSFEAGPPDQRAIEVARVIDRGIREAHAIDQKQLCITPGEKVWSVMVDVCPINMDGNLIDVGAFAAMLALTTARFPTLGDKGQVDYKHKSDKRIPIQHYPLSATVLKVGKTLLIDPAETEESVLDSRLTINIREDGKICALQKGGDAAFSSEELARMLDLAERKVLELRKTFNEARGV
jgi:exosome complex component RRP42